MKTYVNALHGKTVYDFKIAIRTLRKSFLKKIIIISHKKQSGHIFFQELAFCFYCKRMWSEGDAKIINFYNASSVYGDLLMW